MPDSRSRSSSPTPVNDAKRDRDALWSGYNPYFPPVKPHGAGDRSAQSSAVLFDPYFPARHRS